MDRQMVVAHEMTTLIKERMLAIQPLLQSDPRLRSYNTRRGYESDLRRFIEWRKGESQATQLQVEAYASHLLQQGHSPNSVNRSLAAIRWLARKMSALAFEACNGDMGQATDSQRFWMVHGERIARLVKNIPGKRPKKGREVPEAEVRALLEACVADRSPAGVRDVAMIAIGWQVGLRRSELGWVPETENEQGKRPERGLRLADYTLTEDGGGELLIRSGKGDKTRTVPISNGATAYLQDWLTIRGDDPGPLFYAIHRGGVLQEGQGLTGKSLGQILTKRANQAGISKPITWHDFRRTVATEELKRVPITVVARTLGHEDISTTAGYDRSGDEAVREAVKNRLVPYIRRQEK